MQANNIIHTASPSFLRGVTSRLIEKNGIPKAEIKPRDYLTLGSVSV
jgi:hypothetical protein